MPFVSSNKVDPIDVPQGVRLKMLFDHAHGGAQGLALAQAELAPGGQVFPHYHEVEEAAFVLEGSAVMTIDGVATAVEPGDAILIPAGAVHTLKNTSADRPARVISAFGSNDVKRLPAGDPQSVSSY